MRGETVEDNSRAIIRASGMRVLIIDEDSFLAEAFQLVMEDAGFIVETARSGHEALAKAREFPFNLIITDLKLPDINGDKLSRLLKKVNPGVSVVMLTGTIDLEEAEDDVEPEEVPFDFVDPLKLLRVSNSYRNL